MSIPRNAPGTRSAGRFEKGGSSPPRISGAAPRTRTVLEGLLASCVWSVIIGRGFLAPRGNATSASRDGS